LLATVERQYADLLAVREIDFLARYRALPFDARCLYVRLLSRVGPWFREARLDYAELGDISVAVDALIASGLAEATSALPVDAMGRLYTREELCNAFDLPSNASKASLLAVLDNGVELALPQAEEGRVIAPLDTDIAAVMSLLFFGNRHQGLTDFVLSDLGVARYYPYRLDRQRRLFPDRESLEEYLACAALADTWREAREADVTTEALVELGRGILAFQPRHAASRRRWHRLCNQLARELERLDEPELAADLYAASDLHPARERRARVLERAGRWVEALALCDAIEADPWCEEERDAARRIRPRLLRRLHGTRARRQRDDFSTVQLQLPPVTRGVELAVARHLSDQWEQVHYVENTLMNGLFGLAFWEQIFAPVPGVFNNPYQAVPSDMYEQGFAQTRADMLQSRLAELRGADLASLLPATWRRYQGYQCRWVNWRYLDEALVAASARVIPATHLIATWERMLFDPGENRRGFPDLLALGREPGDYCLIEVKGPGDALQDSQKRWLRFFVEQHMPAQVARVQWQDD
jgi:hypothetical protein